MSDIGDSTLKAINQNLAALVQATTNNNRIHIGTFTCAASTSTTVASSVVKADSVVLLMASNAAAGALEAGANKPYVSARTAATSFVVTGAGAAAGTETYSYAIINL